MQARLRSLWQALTKRRGFERAMDEEMAFHLEARAADLVRAGHSPREAARRARLEFGAPDNYKEQCRQARGLRLFDELGADLRYAWRGLKSNPGFSLVAISTLGLAIGANVALFAFVDTYALRPLPIRGADRYVDIFETTEPGSRMSQWSREEIAALEVALEPAVDGLYASAFVSLPLLEPTERMVHGQAVSAGYFELLGGTIALGRPLLPEDDLASAQPVAVLSQLGWQGLLGGDPGALGRRILLGKTWFTIVGIAAPEFRGVEPIAPELWIPLSAHAALYPAAAEAPRYDLAGLLRRGVTPASASALASGVVTGFDRPRGADGEPPRALIERRPSLLHAQERSEMSVLGLLLFASFGLVLVIACANLASLHVARASARHREIATRLSLGSSRFRLVRQLLTESFVLAALGAALGTALALACKGTVQRYVFTLISNAGMSVVPVEIHPRVLGFAVLLALLAGLAFGLLPALEATSGDLAGGSRRDGLALGGRIRPQRLGGLLVAGQVAASLVLLVLASLFLRNARASSQLDPGFETARLIDLSFPAPTPRLLERLEQDPGIAGVTAVGQTPLAGFMPRFPMRAAGRLEALRFNHVDAKYFGVVGIDITEGRAFRAEEAAAAARVVVVSRATAHTLFPGRSPLGQILEVDPEIDEGGPARGRYEVIGVAEDVVSGFFFEGRDPSAVYFPAALPSRMLADVLVRPRGDAAALMTHLRGLCRELDPVVLCQPRTLREIATVQLFPFRAASLIASVLGLVALVLTSIGLYGVVAFAVVQRLREVGVRIALGASAAQVLRLMLGRASRNVLVGLAIGLPVCLLLSHLAARVFKLLDGFSIEAVLGATTLLGIVALVAALIPARRATAADPVISLRAD